MRRGKVQPKSSTISNTTSAYTLPEGVIALEKLAVALRTRADLLTAQEFAAMLDVSMHTIESWRKKGRGPKFVRLERQIYYRNTDIREWVAEHVEHPNGNSGGEPAGYG